MGPPAALLPRRLRCELHHRVLAASPTPLEVERQIRRELDRDHGDYYAGKLEEAAQRGPDEIMTTVYAIVSHSASGVVGKGGSGVTPVSAPRAGVACELVVEQGLRINVETLLRHFS